MTENCLFGVAIAVYAAVAIILFKITAAVNEKIFIIVSRVKEPEADVHSTFNKQHSTNNNNFRRKIFIGKSKQNDQNCLLNCFTLHAFIYRVSFVSHSKRFGFNGEREANKLSGNHCVREILQKLKSLKHSSQVGFQRNLMNIFAEKNAQITHNTSRLILLNPRKKQYIIANLLQPTYAEQQNKKKTNKRQINVCRSEKDNVRGVGTGEISITRLIGPIFIVKICTFQFVYCSRISQI